MFLVVLRGFSLSAQNTPPVIFKLSVIETQQSDQGVKPLIVRGIVTDKEDGGNLYFEYKIKEGKERQVKQVADMILKVL